MPGPEGLAEGEINESEKVASEAVEALAEEESEQQYTTLIDRYAVLHGVSVSLAHAVIRVESNYRPYALGKAGEVGLMQVQTPEYSRALDLFAACQARA